MKHQLNLHHLEERDWPVVADIYKQGFETGNATFQQEVPTWKDWDRGHLSICRMVAESNNEIVGWAALSAVSSRCAYGGVAEVSVYVSNQHGGKGIGSILLNALIEESELKGIWTLQAGIFPENLASIHLHKKGGFREVGYREKIGKMNGVWRDTILFERRSHKVGLE